MLIFIELNGRLGNNLFQLAFGEEVAKSTGKRVFFLPKNSNIADLRYFKRFQFAIFAAFPVFTNRVFKVFFRFVNLRHVMLQNHNRCFDLESKDRFVLLSGYFQDPSYIVKRRDFFPDFFRLRDSYVRRFEKDFASFFEKKVLTVHVRLGDYLTTHFGGVDSNAFIGWAWYRRILDKLDLHDFEYIFLISDDINAALENLEIPTEKLRLSDGKEITDFQLLMNSDSLIISNSSFAWWGAFLNRKQSKTVFAPYNWVGYNAGMEYPKGMMIDDFKWVK